MLRPTVTDLYCSEAGTSNVHVLGRFVASPDAPDTGNEDLLHELQQPLDALRSFICQRCKQTAKEVISDEVVKLLTGASPPPAALLPDEDSLFPEEPSPEVAALIADWKDSRAKAAAIALESCSTRGR